MLNSHEHRYFFHAAMETKISWGPQVPFFSKLFLQFFSLGCRWTW